MAHSLCRNASVSHVVVESSLDAQALFFNALVTTLLSNSTLRRLDLR
jgi:hypothetical protein